MPRHLADRFRAAASRPPLSALAPSSLRELDELLAAVDQFEELPGKWQAALLSAEAPASGPAPARPCGCCGPSSG